MRASARPSLVSALVVKTPRMTLADPWMGGSGHDEKKNEIQ